MRPGQYWKGNGREPGNPFLFKVIEQEEVTVPAGTFQATRIQITNESRSLNPVTGEDQATSLKRSLWLAKDVGILREETVYYSGEHVTVKQSSELVQWVLPKKEMSGGPFLILRRRETPLRFKISCRSSQSARLNPAELHRLEPSHWLGEYCYPHPELAFGPQQASHIN